MPALFGGLVSIIFVETSRSDTAGMNDAGKAGAYQAAVLGITSAIAIGAGCITGLLMKYQKEMMKKMFYTPPPGEENVDKSVHFTDDRYWNVAPGTETKDGVTA